MIKIKDLIQENRSFTLNDYKELNSIETDFYSLIKKVKSMGFSGELGPVIESFNEALSDLTAAKDKLVKLNNVKIF